MNEEFDLSNYIEEHSEEDMEEYELSEDEKYWIYVKYVQEFINEIEKWCYRNNTIPMKDLFKDLKHSRLKLAITDGGWVNCGELIKFIKEKVGEKLK